MPIVIYIFTLSAFALGLAEFVPIGLTDVMAHGLNVNLERPARPLRRTLLAPLCGACINRPHVALATQERHAHDHSGLHRRKPGSVHRTQPACDACCSLCCRHGSRLVPRSAVKYGGTSRWAEEGGKRGGSGVWWIYDCDGNRCVNKHVSWRSPALRFSCCK
jgi:hypothetical protein